MPRSLWRVAAKAGGSLVGLGLLRLIDDGVSSPPGRLSERDARLIHSLQLQPKAWEAEAREGLDRDQSVDQVRAVRSVGNVPLVVLTAAGGIPRSQDQESQALAAFMRIRVYTTQPRLAKLSTRGRQVILENSGHGIPFDAPEAVIEAVRSVLRDTL